MTDDVPDLPANPLEDAGPVVPDEKVQYRAWLWLQLNDKTKYSRLAQAVLSGGPDGNWINKPLWPEKVAREIRGYYATSRHGFDGEMVELADRAVRDFNENPMYVNELIERKLKASDYQQTKRLGEMLKDVVSTSLASADPESFDESMSAGRDVLRQPSDADHPLHTLVGDRLPVSKYDGLPMNKQTMIPIVRCVNVSISKSKSDRGKTWQCRRNAVPGFDVCEIHGGQWIDPEEVKALLRAGQERLVMASEIAIDTVVELAQHAVNESTRLKAAEMILDRTGFQAGIEISISAGGAAGPSNADLLRDRLKTLHGHVIPGVVLPAEDGDEDAG